MISLCKWTVKLLPALVVAAGCSGGREDPGLRRSAEESFRAGRDALQSGSHEEALALLGQATQGGLNADLYGKALVLHAVAAGHLGKFDLAEEDFEILDQGATNIDEVLAAKSFVRGKQGNKAESRSLMQQARKVNPKVKGFN